MKKVCFKRSFCFGFMIIALVACQQEAIDTTNQGVANTHATAKVTGQSSRTINQQGIVSVTGNFKYLPTPPPSVDLFDLESDDDLFVFAEQQGNLLSERIQCEITQPGNYFPDSFTDEQRVRSNLSYGYIPQGTPFNSYYIHHDNASYRLGPDYAACQNQFTLNGTIKFTNRILGLVFEFRTLNASNDVCGLPSVRYCEEFRRFPSANIVTGCKTDRFIISADRKTLTVRSKTDIHHDNIRVITESL